MIRICWTLTRLCASISASNLNAHVSILGAKQTIVSMNTSSAQLKSFPTLRKRCSPYTQRWVTVVKQAIIRKRWMKFSYAGFKEEVHLLALESLVYLAPTYLLWQGFLILSGYNPCPDLLNQPNRSS